MAASTHEQDGRTHENSDDPFDSLLSLEDQYHTEGYNLGVADGSKTGRIEGRLFGLEKGFEKYAQMGRSGGRAAVWKARLPDATTSSASVDSLSGSERLKRHVDRLVELTDPDSLETKNTEDAVNEFDSRLAGVQAKATLISRIVGESDSPSTSRPTSSRAAASPSDGQEVEIGKPGKPIKSGEMEDFAGLPQLSQQMAKQNG